MSASSTSRVIAPLSTPRFSSPKAISRSTVVMTAWSLGVLEDQADAPRQLVRAGRARVELVHRDAAGEGAAVEVRDEAVERAQQGRLAAARAAEQRG